MTTTAIADEGVRPHTSASQQWWVLTTRMVTPSLRNGEIGTLVAASVMFTAGFYIPLKQIVGASTGMSSYAQYLTPMVVLVAITFAAVSAAFRSATDAREGINRRFKAMPVPRLVPVAARLSASMFRCTIAMAVALICGHVIGFRFHGGLMHSVSFCVVALFIGLALSLLGDLIGAASGNPEATTHIIMLPQLIFGMLSIGIQPVERFPEWIQPFVRNQPASQFINALRALAGDTTSAVPEVGWSSIGPALIWTAAIIAIVIPLHARVAARRQ
ncbi:ABC transporter permease [Mycolicibacterium austroafricanum]|uniref:ABC transporter permease n=1 Tax=Mycolicibacterium austroafricanum TaxID=39687 RepID=UPI000CF993C4|nr:ABC transporter permease [Mycolicibacterium austroafricanum]PQP41725.1 antibiotic transporter [Mycolicibacterium austroafricanum]